MLPIKYRLKKRKTFNYIYRNGKRLSGDFVNIFYCPTGGMKIGFSANKKVGNSIVRHRAVRLMREGVKPLLNKLNTKNNYIFIAKEGLQKQHLLYITLDIEKTLKNSNLVI